MAKAAKKRFSFSRRNDMIAGSGGKDVGALQTMLSTYGYLQGSFDPNTFCPATHRAVRRYQRFYGLKPDGIVGPVTKAHMEIPRCGVTDGTTNPSGGTTNAPFVLRGCQYNRNELTYTFLNGTTDLAGAREQEIVRQAFQAWENVANLQFTEVATTANPDFRIAWRSGSHGDGSPFDDLGGPQGNTLAHAFFPPPCGGPNSGDLHFDEAEQWIEDPSANGILLLQVAIHEIGHLLGLSHSADQSAIMFALYAPDRVNLAQDDIDGIVSLYGDRRTQPDGQLTLTARANGNLARGGDTATFELTVPAQLAITLDGPDDADFDLYVRKGERPTLDVWDFRAFTASSNERILVPTEAGATYFVMVVSFSGSGDYTLRVEPA